MSELKPISNIVNPAQMTNLVEVAPHTPLPLLAEVWLFASAYSSSSWQIARRRRVGLTVVGNRLVVLDRLCSKDASV